MPVVSVNCAYPRNKNSSAKPESKNASPPGGRCGQNRGAMDRRTCEPYAMQGENCEHRTAGSEQAYQ
jgi:hypothetical protein